MDFKSKNQCIKLVGTHSALLKTRTNMKTASDNTLTLNIGGNGSNLIVVKTGAGSKRRETLNTLGLNVGGNGSNVVVVQTGSGGSK
uniref:Uncharacterized protein n=1 Tax=Clandestinovirus TaxID=2831644 RepID=A0A8F8KQV2_9VIRU|nr:hypothetical protein KOM_12_77 [Clandestinovirus]